ncbi:hypothetical protein MC378_09645 [Polaribacter sp. MSW13]|uniref:Uncharacterized protein n=1 Tax=Polaribacter marinus TaxID=2916838 RepID=A0A9X1VNN7_9FLAO|nr:hypothetical protein [Polaribacter marinus]MCI2229428.1 hypothetical protein [Polaribacter marinus]
MRKVSLLSYGFFLFIILQSCSKEYPKDFKKGVFKTNTSSNTIKYLYRNFDYQYMYSQTNLSGNKLSKITWKTSGYEIETINKTSKFDSLMQTVILDKYEGDSSFTETIFTDKIDLKFTTTWVKTRKYPDLTWDEILMKNGIKLK